MEKFIVVNSYHETKVAYDPATLCMYIKIGANGKAYEYRGVTQAMYKTISQFNDEGKAIGSSIIYINDKGIFGSEIPSDSVEWD